jgi:hypothetical protein
MSPTIRQCAMWRPVVNLNPLATTKPPSTCITPLQHAKALSTRPLKRALITCRQGGHLWVCLTRDQDLKGENEGERISASWRLHRCEMQLRAGVCIDVKCNCIDVKCNCIDVKCNCIDVKCNCIDVKCN